MAHFRFGLLLIALGSLLGGAAPPISPPTIALADILDSPADFDGRRLRISGFLYTEFESPGLWASEEDFRNDSWHRTAILHHLSTPPRSVEDYEHPLNGRQVAVTGLVTVPDWDATTVEISEVIAITVDPADLHTERRWRVHPTAPMWLLLGYLALVAGITSWAYYAKRVLLLPK